MFWCISFSWKSLAKLTWICKYVWAALKYHLWKHLVFSKIWYDDDDDDKSNDNSCYCSGNSTIFFLFLFLHHFFFTASYFFTYLQRFILCIFSSIFSFVLSTARSAGAIVVLYIFRCTASQLHFILPAPNTSQRYSSFPQLQCQWNQVTSTQELCNCGKSRALICTMPWYTFCFIISFSAHIFIYSFLFYFSAPCFTTCLLYIQ